LDALVPSLWIARTRFPGAVLIDPASLSLGTGSIPSGSGGAIGNSIALVWR
jgi:hypothetical protein